MQVRVNGPDTAPVYKFLKSQKSGSLGARIKWNFTKFLVDEEGHVIRRYSPTTPPLAIENDIKKALRVAWEALQLFQTIASVLKISWTKNKHTPLIFLVFVYNAYSCLWLYLCCCMKIFFDPLYSTCCVEELIPRKLFNLVYC